MRVQTEIQVFGGLSCTAVGLFSRGDASVGWPAGVSDVSIQVRGKAAAWIESRMTTRDWLAAEEALLESVQ